MSFLPLFDLQIACGTPRNPSRSHTGAAQRWPPPPRCSTCRRRPGASSTRFTVSLRCHDPAPCPMVLAGSPAAARRRPPPGAAHSLLPPCHCRPASCCHSSCPEDARKLPRNLDADHLQSARGGTGTTWRRCFRARRWTACWSSPPASRRRWAGHLGPGPGCSCSADCVSQLAAQRQTWPAGPVWGREHASDGVAPMHARHARCCRAPCNPPCRTLSLTTPPCCARTGKSADGPGSDGAQGGG